MSKTCVFTLKNEKKITKLLDNIDFFSEKKKNWKLGFSQVQFSVKTELHNFTKLIIEVIIFHLLSSNLIPQIYSDKQQKTLKSIGTLV